MRWIGFVVVVAIVVIVGANTAWCQEKEEPPKPPVVEKKESEEKPEPPGTVELPEYVVTPGRMEEPVTDITESITVITAKELEESAAIDVAEVLRAVPGLFLRRNGGLGGSTIPHLRGTLGTQTVVLIDGIQVNDPTLGYQFDFDDLDITNIERIEVIRGVEAAMYGPGAVGGVINVITKRGRGKPRAVTRQLAGSRGTGHAQLGSTGSTRVCRHSLAVSQLTTDNAQKNNQSDKTTFSGNLHIRLDEKRSVDFFTRYITSRHEEPFEFFAEDPFIPMPAHIEPDPNIIRRQDQLALGVRYSHKLTEIFSWDTSLSVYDSTSRFTNGDDDGSGIAEFEFTAEAQVITARLQAVCNLDEVLKTSGAKSRILVGGEWMWEDTLAVSSFGFTPDRLANRAGYVQGRLRVFERFLVSVGLRVDGHSTYGTNESPAVGVKMDLWEGGAIRSNWSRAFRPPSNVELTDPWYGNPDLKKERRNGFDLGLLQELFEGKVKLELTYFQTRIDDNIGYDFDTFMMENFDTQAEGIETCVSLALPGDFSIGASFTHVAAQNLKKHTALMGRSPNFGSVRITRRFGPLTATLSGYFSEKVPPEGVLDEKGQVQKNTGKADLVNLALLYQVSDASKLIFKVTNILDKRFKESERAPKTPGIGVFVGVSAEF